MDVVAAALVRDGRVLAARRVRPPGWEFPGGKVEPRESPQQALQRECREELGIDVHVETLLGTAAADGIDLQLWQVRAVAGNPASGPDHHELRWLTGRELHDVEWLPIDRSLLSPVAAVLRVSSAHVGRTSG